MHRAEGSLFYVKDDEESESNTQKRMKTLFRMNQAELQEVPRVEVKVLRFEAPLWFANAQVLSDRLREESKSKTLRGIVLDMSTVPWMDNTAAQILSKTLGDAEENGVFMVFAATATRV